MRIDLPLCNFKNCRYSFDGNCTNRDKYNRCDYRKAKIEAVREFTERMKRCARFGRSAGDTELCYSVYCIEQMLAYVEKEMTKSGGEND